MTNLKALYQIQNHKSTDGSQSQIRCRCINIENGKTIEDEQKSMCPILATEGKMGRPVLPIEGKMGRPILAEGC